MTIDPKGPQHREPRDQNEETSREPESTAERIRAAGWPPQLDEERFQTLRPGLEETWLRANAARRKLRIHRRFALAASFFLAFMLVGWLVSRERAARQPETVAWVTAIDGATPPARPAEGGPEPGNAIVAGTVVSDAAARWALRTVDGHRLRLDAGTRLLPESRHRWRLDSGAVFVDAARDELVVVTSLGEVRHLGTRYLLRVTNEGLRAQVREGQIRWNGRPEVEGRRVEVGRGEGLWISHAGDLQKLEVAPDDPSWDWVALAAPPFLSDGKKVGEVLEYLAAENGWRLETSTALRARLEASTFHGSIEGLAPAEAAELVALSVGLVARFEGLTLRLSRSETDADSGPGRRAATELGPQSP